MLGINYSLLVHAPCYPIRVTNPKIIEKHPMEFIILRFYHVCQEEFVVHLSDSDCSKSDKYVPYK